jgi:hypothetical protein
LPTAIRAAPPFRHDGAHVGEVEVDQAGHGDQLRDALDALAQHVVSQAEGLLERGALVHDLQQPVVGDDDERIHLLLEPVDAALGRLQAPRAFKVKGLVTTPMVKAPTSLAICGDDGRRAGAGAAAQAGGDEHHVGAAQDLVQLFGRLFGGLLATSGLPPAPRPRVSLSPMRTRRGALANSRACASVLTVINSTPDMPCSIMRLTALLPPPPTPTTLMRANDSLLCGAGCIASLLTPDNGADEQPLQTAH